MQHSFRRILSLVLTFAMVLSCVPAQVFAAEVCEHSYDVTVTGAGCTEEGSAVYTCSVCGDTYTEAIAAAGHDYQETERVEAVCGEAGSVTYTCSACGDSYAEELPAPGDHSYAEGVCTVCGAADPDAVPVEKPTEEPTEAPTEATEVPEVIVEDLLVTDEENTTTTEATEGPDGGELPPPPDVVYVAQLGTDGQTYVYLEAAIQAAAAITENRPAVYVLADCTVEETVQINTDITLIYAGEGTVPTITVAKANNSVFEVGAGGALVLENVTVKNNGEIVIQDEGSLEIRGTLEVANGGWLESHGTITVADGGKLEIQSGANMLNCGTFNNGGTFVNSGCVMDCTGDAFVEGGEYVKYDPLQLELFAAMDAKVDYALTRDYTLSGGNLSVHLNDKGQDKLFTVEGAKLIVPSGMELRIRSRAALQSGAELIVQPGGRLLIEGQLTVNEGTWLESHGEIVITNGTLQVQSGADMLNCGSVTNNGGQFVNNGCVMDCGNISIKNTITSSAENSEYVKYDPLQMDLFAAMDAQTDYTLAENHVLEGNLSVYLNDQGQDKQFTIDNAKLIVPSGMELRIRSRAVLQNAAEIIVEQGGRLWIDGGELTLAEGTWLESRGEICIENGGKLELQADSEMMNYGTITNNGEFINDGFIDDFVGIPSGIITGGSGQCRKFDTELQLELFQAMGKNDYVLTRDYTLQGDMSIRLGGYEAEDGYEEYIFTLDNVTLTVPDGCIVYSHSPVMLKGNARILVQAGGTLIINNIIHVGRGTVHMYAGSTLYDNVGIFDLSHEGNTDPYITAYGLNWNEGHFINVGEFGTTPNSGWQLQPGSANAVIFYYHEWDAEALCWERTPISPAAMTCDKGLAFEELQDKDIMPGAENSDYYIRLGAKNDTALWDQTRYVRYNGCEFPVYIQRDKDMGFYSDRVASNETYLTRFTYVPGEDNAFYFICTNPDFTVEDVELHAEKGGVEISAADIVKVDDNIWKIAIKKSAATNDNDGFGINLMVTFYPGQGDENWRWNRFIDCSLWIHNRSMHDASFRINGRQYKYYAAYDRYMVWDEKNEKDEAIELPQGVSYDFASNTLTLNNAELNSLEIGYSWFDENRQEGGYDLPNADFKLNLVGENVICSNGTVPLQLRDHHKQELTVTIGGTGSLYVENTNDHGTIGAVNAADVGCVDLIIADSANVTFHVAGQNYWNDNGTHKPATMHALQGENRSTLRIRDSATLTMEVPEILEDRTDDNDFRYAGLANFTEVIVEGQATVNLDCLHLYHDGETGVSQKFYQRGGIVNVNAHPNCNGDEQGNISYFYDPVNIHTGALLQIEGGKLNINANHSGDVAADGTLINVWQGTLQVSGGQIVLDSNIPGTGIMVDGNEENLGRLNFTSGALTEKSSRQDITFLNIGYNGRATFAGGTIRSDGGYVSLYADTEAGQTPVILWTGTTFQGTGNVVDVEGNFKMTGGLFQLNEGRFHVNKKAAFTGGTMDMNDSAFVANGTANVEGVAKLDFDMTHQVEGGTPVEVGGTMTVGGNARIDIDIELESLEDENGQIDIAGIRNYGNLDQNGGIININSNAAFTDDIVSFGNLSLNAGEMSLTGISGIQMYKNEDDVAGTFIINDGMTLKVNTTRNGINLCGHSWIKGGTVNINVQGTERAYGIYVMDGGILDMEGGNVSVKAFNKGEEDGIGIIADGAQINFMEGTLTVQADQTMMCTGIVGDAATIGFANLMDMENNVQLNSETCWAVHEYDGKNNFDLILPHADNAPAKHVTMNGNVQEETLQAVLPNLEWDTDVGGYILQQAVVLNESMTLPVGIDGKTIKLHVIRNGKIVVRNGATLTIPEGGHMIVANRWEMVDSADGTLIVEAGGQIVNNGILENIQGDVIIMDSANAPGYVHGAKAQMITHSDGLSFRTKGIPTAYQELKGNVESLDGVNGILAEGENGYASVHIWTPSSLNLSGLVIPENVGLDIDGQEAPAQLTIDEGSTFQVLGGISLGNVNLVVNGTLKNSGEIHTDPNDNAQITINGTYKDDGQGKVFLNNANVTVNGKVIHNDERSELGINDRSVVTVAAGGEMSLCGNFGVGGWQMTPDVSVTAGTLNIAGQVKIFNYTAVEPFGETTGGIVNIKNGGNLTIDVDPAKNAYGYLNIGGEVNVEAGGTLCNRNFVEVTGELNVSGNLYNEVGEEYYGEIVLQDAENGNSGSLIASAGATIDNDGGIGHYSSGELRVAAANFTSDAEDSAIYISWLGNRAATNDVAKGMAFLIYEGNDVDATNNMATYARDNEYRNSIVTVVGEMVVGNDQSLASDYVIVTQESELLVNGSVRADVRLNVRSGGTLTITKNGEVYAVKEMNTFAADEAFGDSVVDNRGVLKFAPDATAKILGSYDDLGVGTLIREASFDEKNQLHVGQLTGNKGNLDMANITLSAEVTGENAEYKLIKAIDAVSDYDDGTIWIKTGVLVTEDLQIPETVTIRIVEEDDNNGYLTLNNGVTLDNSGTIYVDVPYAALKIAEAAQASYAGSGVYRGSCGVDTDSAAMSWRLKNGTLTISGNGAMADYVDVSAPWQNLNFSKVSMGVLVTYIGKNAFVNCNASMVIPRELKYFGDGCFGTGMNLRAYHNSDAESYLTANYTGKWDYIHEVVDGECIIDGCDYGLQNVLNDPLISAQEKAEELKNVAAESLKTEMEQAEKDKEANGTQNTLMDQLEQLEKEILEEKNVSTDTKLDVVIRMEDNVSGNVADAFENVSEEAAIVGAVLNAEEGASEVHLVIADAEDADIADDKYKEFNADASVLFSMTMEGVPDASNLEVPVKITLPVPANVDPDNLVIMHYHDESKSEQIVEYILSKDKMFVSFVVTGFSNFLIGEKATPVDLTAKINSATVMVGTDPEDVMITVSARTAWTDEGKVNTTVKDLYSWYIITDETGNEVELEDALQNSGTYTITPGYEKQAKYTLNEIKPVILTVNERKVVCVIGDTAYESLTAALAAAKSGDTVKLLQDAEESYVVIAPGVTLDLQGYALTADRLVGFNGSYLTATPNSGKLIVPQGNIILSEKGWTNASGQYVLLIWDPANTCYQFSLFVVNTANTARGLRINEEVDQLYFQFKHQATTALNNRLLGDGAVDNELEIIVRLQWTDEKGVAYQEFVYNKEQVGYATLGKEGKAQDYTLTLNGYSMLKMNLETLNVYGMIKTNSGATAYGEVWTIENAK